MTLPREFTIPLESCIKLIKDGVMEIVDDPPPEISPPTLKLTDVVTEAIERVDPTPKIPADDTGAEIGLPPRVHPLSLE